MKLFTVTVTGNVVAVQIPFDIVTEYDPDEVTVMDCVVAPFDHKLPVAELDVSTTEPPVQNVVGPPAVTVAPTGAATVADAVTEHPLASVAVTV